MLPHEKARFIQDKKEKGAFVAMVGDGINDTPALSQADLAIGIQSTRHLDQETGDLSLIQEGLKPIMDFQNLAKQVNQKVRQNLIWAFAYNAFSIPLAMSGMITPLVAVTAMLLSSLSVIGNTMLLSRNAP
jgi:P-type E1-E2 ATPase